MSSLDLFPKRQIVGVFRGFKEGGMEFHADLALPYRNDFQNLPMHGQFLLVQLETPQEAALGRITSLTSEGKLAEGIGEEFALRAMQESRPIPEDLRQQYLKYRVDIRVLGVLRNVGSDRLTFAPSHRRLPHVGSPVAFPSGPVLREIAGHNINGAAIGHFALGEYLFAEDADDATVEEWMQVKGPEVRVRFPIESLVSRRSFIFARAGYGKSNLNKLLFSKLYETTPTVAKGGGRQVPVGTVLFDPDGEYFWPDDKGRPGLCDVPALQDRLVVFTSRQAPSLFYQSFVAGSIKIDLRRFSASDVLSLAVPSERQEQQNVRKLKDLTREKWERLVNLIDESGNQTPLFEICRLLDLDMAKQEMEALAARANMTAVVRTLHDRSSQLLDRLMFALRRGKLCVVDVSQLRGDQALKLSGLLLRRIFDNNQSEFTAAQPKTVPTLAVIEEAQSVLRDGAPASEPYIAWVKEGRKYDLGAVMVTQQPGSIPNDILSQGDNWFLFHLLSSGDLQNVKRANAHFSDDLLSALLNEPIPGQGVFWSGVGGKPYPVAFRALSFERIYSARDPDYAEPEVPTFASKMKRHFERMAEEPPVAPDAPEGDDSEAMEVSAGAPPQPADALEIHKRRGIAAFESNFAAKEKLRGAGLSWGQAKYILLAGLPDTLDNRDEFAYQLVREAMTRIYGSEGQGWETVKVNGRTLIRAKTSDPLLLSDEPQSEDESET
jgi:hypothetical protein